MDDAIQVLMNAKTIAVVGLDAREDREAYRIATFLKAKGYRVVPVPVQQPADEVLGEKAYPSLRDIPFPIDLADVFVRSEYTDPIIDDAIAARVPAIWLQLSIRNDEGLSRARAAGMVTTQDLCTAVEYQRAKGEWRERATLLPKLDAERQLLLAAAAPLDPEAWEQPSLEGGRSPLSRFAELAAAEVETLEATATIAGVHFARPALLASETPTPESVLEDLAAAHAAALDFVDQLPEEAFQREGQHPTLGSVRVIQLLRSIYGRDQRLTGELNRRR